MIIPNTIKLCTFVISTVRRPIGRPDGHEVAFKRSASSPLRRKASCGGMKVFFTLSEAEGLDSAALCSPLGTPDGGDDTSKRSY